jgi:thioredoxin reductase (NADPH)
MSEDKLYNVIIIGRGIASYTAAIYTARAGLEPVVLRALKLDQLSLTTIVENFPGFPDGVNGPDLIENAAKQAQKFGTQFINEEAIGFELGDEFFTVSTKTKTLKAKAVIIATGASARWLGIPNEDKYVGRGVSTCATCDAALYRDKKVVIVGGGDSAMEEALVLAKFANHVTIIHRKDEFRASKIMQERVFAAKGKIDIMWNTAVVEVLGDDNAVTGLKLKNTQTGEGSEFICDGMFLAIGHVTNTEIFKGKIELDDQGYIVTDKRARTSVPGVFAAGDCQDPIFRQAITSAGSGCAAALEAERYIESREPATD